MNTAELKIDIINKKTSISDSLKLKEILHFLKIQSEEVHIVNEKDRKSIEEAREQIKNGEVITNEAFHSEIKEWLEK